MTTSTIRSLAIFALIASLAGACSQDPAVASQEALKSGNAFFDKGQYNEAVVEYRRAIQLDAQFGEARHRLSEAYLKLNDTENAVRELLRAADLLPDNLDLQIQAGNLVLRGGQYEEARARADKILARDPQRAEAHVLRGSALAGLRDLDGALAEMERAVDAEPGSSAVLTSLGAIQHLRGESAKADEAFAAAVKLDPASSEVQMAYANYLLRTGRVQQAEEPLKDAVRRTPGHVLANRALAAYYAATGRPEAAEPYLKRIADDTSDPAAKFMLAQLYLRGGRTAEADLLLTALGQQKETYVDARLLQARSAYGRGEGARAHALVKEVLERSQNDARPLVVQARFLLLDKKPADAVAAAKAAVATDPSLVAAHIALGDGYRALRDVQSAIAAFTEAARLKPDDAGVQVALSQLHLASGGVDLATQFANSAAGRAPNALIARKAVIRAALVARDAARVDAELLPLLKQFPQDAELHVFDGTRRQQRSDLKGAERAFQSALEKAPDYLPAHSGLLTIELATKRNAAARLRVERLVSRPDSSVSALLLAAQAYAALNDLPQAEASLRRAIQVDPARAEPYGLLGQLYVKQQKLDQALAELRTLAARTPSVAAHTMSGMILEMQNRKSDAKAEYRKALNVNDRAAVAANNLASIMVDENDDLDEALRLAQVARAGLPQSPEVGDTLGWIYYKKGLTHHAITFLEESVKRDPRAAGYHYHLGLAYGQNGDVTAARQSLGTALKLNPTAPEAREARTVLEGFTAAGF